MGDQGNPSPSSAQSTIFRNPHLDGSPFFWRAGSTGILLVHGLTATTTEVRLLAQDLYTHGYTVAAPLLPGHDTTPQDCNRYTWQDWYAAVEKSYLQLKSDCQKVVVGGESAGALLALRLAHLHPEAAAILCYAPALRYNMSDTKITLLTMCAPFLPSIPKAPSRDNNPWKGYKVNPLKAALQLKRLQGLTDQFLPQVRQPVLIIQSKLDRTADPRSAQMVYDRVGSCKKELHWLEHSSHCVILDKERDLVTSWTLDFLQRILK